MQVILQSPFSCDQVRYITLVREIASVYIIRTTAIYLVFSFSIRIQAKIYHLDLIMLTFG